VKIRFRLLFAKENESVLFCYIWVLVCLVLFTLVRTEHSRYMLPGSSAVAILTAKFFADMEKLKGGLDWPGYKVPAVLTGIVLLVTAIFSGVALYILGLSYPIPAQMFVLPVIFFAGGIALFGFNKKRQHGNQIFAISFLLVMAFSLLSAEVLPHINRYPMKLFSEKILSEDFSGSIAVYQLGNQRARLGVLTGQKVLGLYSPSQINQFIDIDEPVLIVMREKDLRESFSDAPLKVVAEDIAWLKGRIDWKRMKELWGKAESAGFSNLTEKIYLLSNK